MLPGLLSVDILEDAYWYEESTTWLGGAKMCGVYHGQDVDNYFSRVHSALLI
jgi:hypothetical protein